MTFEDACEMLHQAKRYYPKVKKEVNAFLETLTPRENAILGHFYGLGRQHIGYKIIAERFDLTSERTCQIMNRGIKKIAEGKPRVSEVIALLMALVKASNPDPFETEEGRQQAVKAVLDYREELKQWPKETDS